MDSEHQSDKENVKKIMKAIKFKKWYDDNIKEQKPKRKCPFCEKEIAYMNLSKHKKSQKCLFYQVMIQNGFKRENGIWTLDNPENPEN